MKLMMVVCLWSLCSVFCFAENFVNYKFHSHSPEGGVYFDGVNSIQQDKNGFMWIAMGNNIFRFDGYRFKSYYLDFRLLAPFDYWNFKSIETDSFGRMFVATNNGLFLYNSTSDEFQRLFKPDIFKLHSDDRGNLWVAISNAIGVFHVDRKYFVGITAEDGKSLGNVSAMCSSLNTFAVGTNDGKLYLFDYAKMVFKNFYSLPFGEHIKDMKIKGDDLWVLTEDDGLYKINYKSGKLTKQYDFFCVLDNEYVPARALYIDKNDYIWIGTQRGIYIMNPENEQYTHIANSSWDTSVLPDNSIWTIAKDLQNNIWIGTYSGGLGYLNLQDACRFQTYTLNKEGLNHRLISGFAEDDSYLWIATEGGGINQMNKSTGIFNYYTHIPNKNSLSYDNVKSLAIDSMGNLWIAMFRGGLDCYNFHENRFENFQNKRFSDSLLISNNLKKIVLEADTGLWIAYQAKGISYYSFKSKKFKHYRLKKQSGKKAYGTMSDLCRGKGDDLWIISGGDLFYMNTQNRQIDKIQVDSVYISKMQTLCLDKSDDVWIGTIGSGLFKYDRSKQRCIPVMKMSTYNISSIYSLCIDNNNVLWIGTENGLFKYDIATEELFRFDKSDGLQGNCFYPNACLSGKDGRLYFGGTNGFTVINSQAIHLNQFKPTAVIVDFYIDNRIVLSSSQNSPLKQSIFTSKRIVLNHNQKDFGFGLSSNSYLKPEKNRFKYRLQGYNDKWTEVDAASRTISYTKIPAGTYVFEVLAANNDGVWSEVPTRIVIERLAAPWGSWWAYSLYILGFLLVTGLIVYYYHRQKALKLKLYLDGVESKQKEEMHQAKLRFFTNISHDFRTPLSLIMATVEHLKQEIGDSHYLRLLDNNARRLLNLVNELMDFRTIENGKMKLKVASCNINKFVKEIADDFFDYSNQKGIGFEVSCDDEIVGAVYCDKQIVEKIVMNLLNNAFKYTKEGGYVSIETYSSKESFKPLYSNKCEICSGQQFEESFCILIRDNGIGISDDSVKHIFDRYYKVESNETEVRWGSGIGLALVKSLVILHKGSLSVYSEQGKGSEFLIQLPSSLQSYDIHEQMSDEEHSYIPRAYFVETENTPLQQQVSNQPYLRVRKQILLAEDNQDLRCLIAEELRHYYDVIEVPDGQKATEIIKGGNVDLIISDIMMPLKDGTTLCREIKENINTSYIPVILLTAKGGVSNQLEGFDSGADMYLEKPVDFQLLVRIIQNMFSHQQHIKEHYSKKHFLENTEALTNKQDNKFIDDLISLVDSRLDQADMDVNYIASQLSMSRSKLYSKVKALTGKSIIEFVRSRRLQKAAYFLVEENLSIREAMERIGMESQSYFTKVFKEEFGATPNAFVSQFKSKSSTD